MLTATILGADRVSAYLTGLPPRLFGILKTEVSRLTLELLRKVKEGKLSGQVLKNQTGTLRRKINQQVVSDEHAVVGKVGVKISYAAAHEFGFDGVVTVQAHLRRCKAQMAAALRTRKDGSTYHSNKGKGSGEIQVRSFSRHMHLPERSFLRSALREMAPEIQEGIANAVKKAVERA